jgi:hypothetical protein
MLTIKGIDKIVFRFKENVIIEQFELVYRFYIDNPNYLGGKNGIWQPMKWEITLSRVHPPDINHPHRNYYLLSNGKKQMWLLPNEITLDKIVDSIKLMAYLN